MKVLPDEPRGIAWPSSARAVRCPAKPGNERDLHPQLPVIFSEVAHSVGTALETMRKVQATIGLYGPNLLGYTRATMIRTMGCDTER